MRKLTLYTTLIITLCACKSYSPDGPTPYGDSLTVRAAIADETRTLLEGTTVAWQSTDKIGLYSNVWSEGGGEEFAIQSITGNVAIFKGAAINGSTFYAYYPYSESAVFTPSDAKLTLTLPATQSYTAGGFGSGANPMIATATNPNNMIFYNLCGVVELKITGTGKITSITVSSVGGEPLSGEGSVSLNYGTTPDSVNLITFSKSDTTVTLSGIDTTLGIAVQTFFIVVPAATYASGLRFTIANDSGTPYVKTTSGAVTVLRSNIQPFKSFDLDLVALNNGIVYYGDANCLQTPAGSTLSADITPHYTYRSMSYAYNSTSTLPATYNAQSAAVLWENPSGLITSATVSGTTLDCTAAALSGNAVVALYDAPQSSSTKQIIWSFHIWAGSGQQATNDIQYTLFGGGTGNIFMDRNLGATALTGSDATGLLYQWGRKDAFTATAPATSVISSTTNGTIAYSIQNPATFIEGSSATAYDWYYGNGTTGRDTVLWGRTDTGCVKSVFDPCPEGYKTPPENAWTICTSTGEMSSTTADMNISGTYASGWNFYTGGWKTGTTTFYPVAGYIYGSDASYIAGASGYWSYEPSGSYVHYFYVNQIAVEPDAYFIWHSSGFNVRCVRV